MRSANKQELCSVAGFTNQMRERTIFHFQDRKKVPSYMDLYLSI
jgi:hypothetical protein